MARFTRTHPVPYAKGGYGAFRPYVREDFERCCAYRLLHEDWAHGENNFQLDHFRPKDPLLFPHLKNNFYNLYYACSVCNGPKGKHNHWPSHDLIDKGVSFIDFCQDDVAKHYDLLPDGSFKGLSASAKYTIDTIRLNRQHFVAIRKWAMHKGYILDKKRF